MVGRPNVGKSSLINDLMGIHISGVSHREGTTRHGFDCTMNWGRVEFVFFDTPGIQTSGQEMNIRMNGQMKACLAKADYPLIVTDFKHNTSKEFDFILRKIDNPSDVFIIFTKSDINSFNLEKIHETIKYIKDTHGVNVLKYWTYSPLEKNKIDYILKDLTSFAREGVHRYDKKFSL